MPSVRAPRRDYRIGLALPIGESRRTTARGYDVVHVHTFGPVGLAGLYSAWRHGLPVVVTWHTDLPAYARFSPEVRAGLRASAAVSRGRRLLAGRTPPAPSTLPSALSAVDAVIAVTGPPPPVTTVHRRSVASGHDHGIW